MDEWTNEGILNIIYFLFTPTPQFTQATAVLNMIIQIFVEIFSRFFRIVDRLECFLNCFAPQDLREADKGVKNVSKGRKGEGYLVGRDSAHFGEKLSSWMQRGVNQKPLHFYTFSFSQGLRVLPAKPTHTCTFDRT